MTHSSHRFTMLSADDVALCRAHSEAIEQDGYSRMLVAEVVVESDFKRSGRAVLPADLPLPPDYWSDLEHWLKTLAPAKPAAEQPEPAADVWHSTAPSVAGVYIASTNKRTDTRRYWNGSQWSMPWYDESTEHVYRSRPTTVPILWLHLIEADKPAQQPAQKASTHSVCIKAHGFADWQVGDVWPLATDEFAYPEYWLPCDESGWVTHVPTADAVCPVPEGVDHETKRRNGEILGSDCSTSLAWQLGHKERRVPHEDDIIAWRPIAQS